MVTVWNPETAAGPDKVRTEEAELPPFKGKLKFINFFLWAPLFCVGTIEDKKGKQITRSGGKKEGSETGFW